jgi:hypothetical protein
LAGQIDRECCPVLVGRQRGELIDQLARLADSV